MSTTLWVEQIGRHLWIKEKRNSKCEIRVIAVFEGKLYLPTNVYIWRYL